MLREFRRLNGSKVWHLNNECPDWPLIDYEIWIGSFVPPGCEKLCDLCYISKNQHKHINDTVITNKTVLEDRKCYQ